MKQPSVHPQRVCNCGIQVTKKKATSDDKTNQTKKKTRKSLISDDKTLTRFGHATVSDFFKGKFDWKLSEHYFE